MKERIISAVIVLLLIIPFILLGGIYFDITALIIGLLGLKEILDLKNKMPIYIKLFCYISFIIMALFGYIYIGNVVVMDYSLMMIISIILITSMLVFQKENDIENIFFVLGFIILLSSFIYLVITIRNIDLYLLIYLIFITTITDSGAYFIGREFGKNKLMPKVSPNKTIEGFIGGLIFGTIFASLFYYFLIGTSNIILMIAITLILSFIGQVGDLIFSSIKRYFKIKDFSNIMPGHGGVLDRLDSLIFVVFTYIIFSVII